MDNLLRITEERGYLDSMWYWVEVNHNGEWKRLRGYSQRVQAECFRDGYIAHFLGE